MFPAVALLGSRQCGKTTLAKQLGGQYFDMELSEDQLKLDLKWDTLIDQTELIILDEAQAAPDIFLRIRAAIDQERKRKGRFLLLGSVSPMLMKGVSESLAGRIGYVDLSPFSLDELPDQILDDHWLKGGYPDGGILEPLNYPRWHREYLRTLTERDLPNWGLPASPVMTQRLLKMLSAVQGDLWNASKVSSSLGIDAKTLQSYLDYLEGGFLVRRLSAFSANSKKRLVKSPKVYIRDSGLLHSLFQIASLDQLLEQPWVGNSWEGYVIEQLLSHLDQRGIIYEPFFFRTSDGYEIDLLLEVKGKRIAIEIKLSSHPSLSDVKRLEKTALMAGADQSILISRTPEVVQGDGILHTHLKDLLERGIV